MSSPSPTVTETLRAPEEVMRLARLGAHHNTRLSFLRDLIRRMQREGWRIERTRFDIDAKGVGVAVHSAIGPERTYSLVAFAQELAPEKRTDRVIAEEWDATFALFDGVPTDADIDRLRRNVPRQEAGRVGPKEIVLARANKSVRLFDSVVAALATGRQPDAAEIDRVGYLMRTTAVYGSGKFGLADRESIAARPELSGPFRAEMLAVYLIRAFTLDLAEHMAKAAAPTTAVPLAPHIKRRFGIGNATGLGMAPFVVRHPALFNNWILARERAIARVLALPAASKTEQEIFRRCLGRARGGLRHWLTDDPVQGPRTCRLGADLDRLIARVREGALDRPHPWRALAEEAAQTLSPEGRGALESLMLEPYGALVDDLADTMAADEAVTFPIDGREPVAETKARIERLYDWALGLDFANADERARFWYVSEEKLEPRLGERASEDGAELEQPLATARDVAAFHAALAKAPASETLAAFLLRHPEHRHAARRVSIRAGHSYAEITDNLIAASLRPIDILRCTLAFFGATRFDPRSDKWLRITLFQNAPLPEEIATFTDDHWIYGTDEVPA